MWRSEVKKYVWGAGGVIVRQGGQPFIIIISVIVIVIVIIIILILIIIIHIKLT